MVERGTGIGRVRLRVWERRHGFPGPERNAKGERSYPEEQLQRPQRTRRLLDRGMRPGKLLPESSEQLNKTVGAVLDAVRSADDGQVEVLLRRQCEKRSMQRFVLETAIPLLQSVRELCISGKLQIYQKHFLPERDDSARWHRSRAPWPVGPCLASHKHFSFIGACKP